MNWFKKFWNTHGERLVFVGIATSFSAAFWYLDMKAEAKTILTGLGMLMFHKARGGNGTYKENEKPKNSVE